ncbi:unnamed protein product [Lupinus luteus]|uniref:Uncharacterized protein n=1 Tax=Lupinus luteus TaxID=3873 RepID=A0AAV1WFQ8_LUPLU
MRLHLLPATMKSLTKKKKRTMIAHEGFRFKTEGIKVKRRRTEIHGLSTMVFGKMETIYTFDRYVAQGTGILQPHSLIDELENVVVRIKQHWILKLAPLPKSSSLHSFGHIGVGDNFHLSSPI